MTNEFGIDLDDAVAEIQTEVEQGVNFLFSEFGDDWERAERYFAGGTDMPDVEGRSKVVKTEVRDTIRALKPSIMRSLLHARKPVEYVPASLFGAQAAEQQSLYATQTFWANGGYKVLMSATDESMKKKIGPIKTYWEENPYPEYTEATRVSAGDVKAIEEAEDVEIESISPNGGEGEEELFDVTFYKYYMNGRVRMEAFPAIEFFINRNASSIDDATVHGHRRDATVAEAIALGLDYDDWQSLGADDPEQNEFQGESYARRGYQKHSADDLQSSDLMAHRFLLTECYCEYDLDGTGNPQKYVFWMGGSGYKYLGHDKIEDWCIDLVEIDPVPFAALGRSIPDLTMKEQDLNTSVLRAIVDNFHMANNPRPWANPMLVDFNDLMNNSIGAPIKTKPGAEIGTYDIPFTGQQGLPLLQFLEQDVQNKTGVTKASQGLDPDAMQSTDKEAVKNTIMLAQGQVELIVRNIIETALIGVFKKLLRLSVRHMDRAQLIRSKGMIIPVDMMMVDPDLVAVPNVGLGSANDADKAQTLLFFLGKQEQYLKEYGFDNPFVGLTHVYNTIEDLAELGGFYDVGRYFKLVTPEIEQQLGKQRQEAQQKQEALMAEQQPMDPSKAMIAIESGKARMKNIEILAGRESDSSRLELDAIRHKDDADIRRDKLEQDRIIDLLQIQEAGRAKRADTQIRRAQLQNNKAEPADGGSTNNGDGGASSEVSA